MKRVARLLIPRAPQAPRRCFSSASTFSTSAPAAATSAPPLLTPETQITTLPSGLRVATEKRHGETATVGVWIDAGSRYETKENNGAAHFLEHLAFKGTPRRTQHGLEVEVENMGAHLNAYTSREQTVYFAKCFKQDVEKAMDLLSDILLHSNLSSSSVERERSVIVREMEEVSRQHEEVIMDHLHEAAYKQSGLGMTILGPEKNINSLRQDQFRAYIDTHYTAPRMVVCGVGNVDHAHVVDLARQYWDKDLPVEPRTNYPTNFDPAVFGGGEVRQSISYGTTEAVEEAHLAVAFEGCSWTDPDAFPLMVAQAMLGTWDRLSGAGAKVPSPLAAALASSELVHSMTTLNISYKDTGLFGVYLVGDQDQMPAALEVVSQNLARLAAPDGVTAAELARAKVQLKASLMQQLGTFAYVAEDIGRQVLTYGRRMSVAEAFLRIDAVTLEDVMACAAARFTCRDKSVAVAALGTIDRLPDYDWINNVMRGGGGGGW